MNSEILSQSGLKDIININISKKKKKKKFKKKKIIFKKNNLTFIYKKK